MRHGSGGSQRTDDAVAQRRDPEILLERSERRGERLGQRPGSEQHRTPTVGRCDRGDRPALQQPETIRGIDQPLDVLGRTEDLLCPPRHLREGSSTGPVEWGDVSGVRHPNDPSPTGQHVVIGHGGAAHERVGPGWHDLDDDLVAGPGDRIDAEHDATEPGAALALYEHRHRPHVTVGVANRRRRTRHPMGGVEERIPSDDIEHRGEASRHRRFADVLDDGRRSDHERLWRTGAQSLVRSADILGHAGVVRAGTDGRRW